MGINDAATDYIPQSCLYATAAPQMESCTLGWSEADGNIVPAFLLLLYYYFFAPIRGVKAAFSMTHRAPCEPAGVSRSQISRRGKSEPFSGLPKFMEEFL